jgi:hypothetical protein
MAPPVEIRAGITNVATISYVTVPLQGQQMVIGFVPVCWAHMAKASPLAV